MPPRCKVQSGPIAGHGMVGGDAFEPRSRMRAECKPCHQAPCLDPDGRSVSVRSEKLGQWPPQRNGLFEMPRAEKMTGDREQAPIIASPRLSSSSAARTATRSGWPQVVPAVPGVPSVPNGPSASSGLLSHGTLARAVRAGQWGGNGAIEGSRLKKDAHALTSLRLQSTVD